MWLLLVALVGGAQATTVDRVAASVEKGHPVRQVPGRERPDTEAQGGGEGESSVVQVGVSVRQFQHGGVGW